MATGTSDIDGLEVNFAVTFQSKIAPSTSVEVDESFTSESNFIRVASMNAVVVENAHKSYGSKKRKCVALAGLQMTVPHGAIYGLLGPSGCGKTTLLGCLVNRLKLDSGKISLFGYEPGTVEAAVPGQRVGYMPQELALYQEFSIYETLQYFGRLHKVGKLSIEERAEFLIRFLDLPAPEKLINQLSGGQQRRVSLAASLIHKPELLILDEPTVGVDPLLRSSIWRHLLEVSRDGNTTIVVTTHYIEEARQADKVGLMREGRLLAETSPQNLLDYYKLASLEDVFLKLCVVQVNNSNRDKKFQVEQNHTNKVMSNSLRVVNDSGVEITGDGIALTHFNKNKNSILVKPWVSDSKADTIFSVARSYALIIKNLIRMKRNIWFLVFSFFLPPFQTTIFCVTVGGNPHDLPVAVVNLDDPGFVISHKLPEKISDLYLENINPHTIKQINYETFEAGIETVEDGKAWSLIFFNESFTEDVVIFPSRTESTYPSLQMYFDNTNQELAAAVKISLLKALETTAAELAKNYSDYNISAFLEIFLIEEVYGVDDSTFRNFVAPGVILTISYFMAVGLTALSFIIERKEGLLDRSWVAGVRPGEVMFSHLITQMLVMIVQITLVLVVMFPIFKIPCEGNIFWVILLAFLQGFSGMTFGLMVSTVATEEVNAMMLIMGVFYPILMISGIVWPLEGMPTFMRYIAYIFPQTFACEGLRAVMYRGWGIDHFVVWIGYVITILWSIFYLAIAAIAIQLRK